MYKGHSTWDGEQEKYDNIIIHRDESQLDYHNQRDYASGNFNPSDVYNIEKGEEDRKKEETGIEKEVMKEEKKYQKREEGSGEEVKRKVASEIHEATKKEGEVKKDKKAHTSIEDAINKAMKEEKEVIYMGD